MGTTRLIGDWEAFRTANGWPTPMNMRRVAGALDQLISPGYGDVLRYVADACDWDLAARQLAIAPVPGQLPLDEVRGWACP